jgi:5'-nucleotidase/UDP-sugar diphosphatase
MIPNRGSPAVGSTKALVSAFEAELAAAAAASDPSVDAPLLVCGSVLETVTASLRTKETNAAGLVADAMRSRLRSDLAIINGGFIRGDRCACVPPV